MTDNVGPMLLAGKWRFAIDPEDKGSAEKWFENFPETGEHVQLPGSIAENGKGNDVTLETPWIGRIRDTSFYTDDRYAKYREPGNIKLPFWLTPAKHYIGVAWYQREFDLPEALAGKLRLELERPHWTTAVWVDGVESVGNGESLSTKHSYTIHQLKAGVHRVTVRVDNRMHVDVGEDAHSITDHSQTNWNGIIGKLQLVPEEELTLHNVQVYPNADAKSVAVKIDVSNTGDFEHDCALAFEISSVVSGETIANTSVNSAAKVPDDSQDQCLFTHSLTIDLDAPVKLWDEFNPELYELKVKLTQGDRQMDARTVRFGFRQFEARGTQFYLNGRATYLRGTLECCVFPLTGYPPMEKAPWSRIMRILKNHGLNHMRFHSWCPPEAAFVAADEEGIIFSVECASWATVGFDEKYEQWLYKEADHILREYGNHPSFCMMLYGNEPYGFRAADFLSHFVNHYKKEDSRRLFSSGTAWPLIPENQFQVWANPRIQYWDQNLDSRINANPPETTSNYADYLTQYEAPIISHEIGQWCVYPNFSEISKYTGLLRPGNLEIFQDFLENSGMIDLADDFLMASGRLQVLCYKEEIESALRTRGMGGFQLLDLHDFPGQGTALVGVLDPFWDPKPYVDSEEFRQFCAPVVPLVEMEKRVYTSTDTFSARVLVAQFGADNVPAGNIEWALSDGRRVVYTGTIAVDALAPGELHVAGEIDQCLTNEKVARKLSLEVMLPGDTGSNQWEIWVYPENLRLANPTDVHITGTLDESARGILRSGGKVLLMPDVEQIKGDDRGQVPPGFSSIFWNTAWTQGQQPHTLGILCDPEHPALQDFPTEYHSNWQWWYIIQRSRSMIMDSLPGDFRPIVQVIDDWFTARKLGLIFECSVEGGKLLVCSVDLKDGGVGDPVGRQMYHSLLKYMAGPDFEPASALSVDDIGSVIEFA